MSTERFVGVDVSSEHLDIHVLPDGQRWRVANEAAAILKLVEKLVALSPKLVVMEATGGYEGELAWSLAKRKAPVSVVNPRQVRDFAKALGKLAKTDGIDAEVLALFAQAIRPRVTEFLDEAGQALEAAVTRRRQLIEMIVAEQNRLTSCRFADVKKSHQAVILALRKQLKKVDKDIDGAVRGSSLYKDKVALLQTIPGVGRVVATVVAVELPEAGKLDSKKLSALVGLAPLNRDSGKSTGLRHIWGGRASVRATLYMAALVGMRWNPPLRDFYRRLIARGKTKKSALTACMRKLLTWINAMLRDNKPWTQITAAGA